MKKNYERRTKSGWTAIEFLGGADVWENTELKAVNGLSERIILKGAGWGIRVVFPESGSEEKLIADLDRTLAESTHLSGGMAVVLDFQGRSLSRPFIMRLLSEFVWPRKMKVLSWVSLDGATLDDLRSMGAATGEPILEKSPDGGKTGGEGFLLLRSLRSGQRLEHEGDVVILGHVNDGAEVLASGSICVWGRLKGLAHAGLDGLEDRMVVAGAFEAKQVRIGGKVSSSLGASMEWWGKPVIIAQENDSLVVRELKL